MSSIFHYLRLDTFIYLYSRDIVARDRMVVGFTTTYAISAYCNWCCGFDSRSGRGVQHCDQVCQWFAAGRWFSPGILVSSTNKTYCHDITEILLKVALNTIKKTIYLYMKCKLYCDVPLMLYKNTILKFLRHEI